MPAATWPTSSTRAERDGDEWVVTGQKVWTSLAHQADWCFVLCRTEAGSARHRGLSYLLVPMDQPGVDVRPIEQLTRTSEFNEVFFDGARTDRANVVGEPGDGWRVALATLAFERGVATARPPAQLPPGARPRGLGGTGPRRGRRAGAPPAAGRRLRRTGDHAVEHPAEPLGGGRAGGPAGGLHRQALLGELAPPPRRAGHRRHGSCGHRPWPSSPTSSATCSASFLFSRAETIYGGSNEIQRTIIGERVLGLPAEPKVTT